MLKGELLGHQQCYCKDGRSPEVKPDSKSLGVREPQGQGYHGAWPSPPGAFPAGGVAVRPPYSGVRHGAAARFALRTVLQVRQRPAVPASLPCPSSHLQAQVTNGRDRGAEPRLTRDAVPRTSRGTRALAAQRPSRMQRLGGKGRRGPLRLRGPAPRPSPGSEEGLRPPLAASPGVAPGRRGGRARGAGRPRGSDDTWCSGGERAPPASRLLARQRAPEPAS